MAAPFPARAANTFDYAMQEVLSDKHGDKGYRTTVVPQRLGGATPLEVCLSEARQAGYAGIEMGGKFPTRVAELKPILDRHGLALISGRGFLSYGTAKGALARYTELAAQDLAPRIRVNAIAAGTIATAATEAITADPGLRSRVEAATPLRRLGTADDVAAAVLYLASPASAYLTGTVLEVHGGLQAPNTQQPLPDL